MNKKIIALITLAACACLRLTASDLDTRAASFEKLASGIIAQAVTGKIDSASVKADVTKMESLAADFANDYKAKYPAGSKLMDFMLSKKDSLSSMSLADIDAQFESEAINKAHGSELGLDLTNEDNEHFGNTVDLFVHPATAQICADLFEKDHNEERLKRMQSELQEVIEHCHKVVAKLKA